MRRTRSAPGQPPARRQSRATGRSTACASIRAGGVLTTNQGVPVADNQNSLKAGLRGPALLEDFILREKITHFDHERIPERIVHARGSGAHGYFECYEPLTSVTRASLFAEAGKRTPVFVRFSTVAGERGSTDTARDVRGFAVKFYTDEGNWDLVGNNIPVFFIQDAMKFPDLVHAAKPEPHHAMPQAATAHDTFWDFVSLMPESTHMLMWVMSDRAIPRSYRMMQGFGVHTFRFVNAEGESRFVKFHWNPVAGTHSLDWDEAVKISGADPDFHRRDLWEAIEAGAYPEWELGVADVHRGAGRAVQLRRARRDQDRSRGARAGARPSGGWCSTATPTISSPRPSRWRSARRTSCRASTSRNDPLLAGRIHSYVDTQITRLGGPNFHEIPINAPVAQVHNNQRDGMHRQAIPRGRVAYEPNSLGGGCPFQAGHARASRRSASRSRRTRCAASRRNSPSTTRRRRCSGTARREVEQAHIVRALPLRADEGAECRPCASASCRHAAQRRRTSWRARSPTASAWQLPEPMPRALHQGARSRRSRRRPRCRCSRGPGDGSIRTRRVAILVADGVDGEAAQALHAGLAGEGAVPRYIGPTLGAVNGEDGDSLEVEITLETMPSVLLDAVAVPGGDAAAKLLGKRGSGGGVHLKRTGTASRSSRSAQAARSSKTPGCPGCFLRENPIRVSCSSTKTTLQACCRRSWKRLQDTVISSAKWTHRRYDVELTHLEIVMEVERNQLNELLCQALETELGGVNVYETALQCAVNDDLKREWTQYLAQTREHVRVLREVFELSGLDPSSKHPVARWFATSASHWSWP